MEITSLGHSLFLKGLTSFMDNANSPGGSLSPLPLYWEALEKSMPGDMLGSSLSLKNGLLCIDGHQINIDSKVNVLAYGKASRLMYEAARKIIGQESFGRGMLITHEDLAQVTIDPTVEKVLKSSHPFITELSVIAGEQVKEFVSSSEKSDILLVLVSGGGSAMVALPIQEISLDDKISFISDVMHASVPEREVNILKKALSQIKGGKLAELSTAKVIINCILSDERSHEISAISSGMTVCNELINPIDIMEQYCLWNLASDNITKALRSYGEQKNIGCSKNIINSIIGSREDLMASMIEIAQEYGFESVQAIDTLHSCTPDNAVSVLVYKFEECYKAAAKGKHLIISTGEVQVKVDTTKGTKGGRNQHLVALFMLNFSPSFDFFFSAIATDGVDYLDGVHGAFYSNGMKPLIDSNRNFIISRTHNSDSYAVHKMMGSLLEGPKTGTNMSDFFLFSFHKI